MFWAVSSAGRAVALQAIGHWFKPSTAHYHFSNLALHVRAFLFGEKWRNFGEFILTFWLAPFGLIRFETQNSKRSALDIRRPVYLKSDLKIVFSKFSGFILPDNFNQLGPLSTW